METQESNSLLSNNSIDAGSTTRARPADWMDVLRGIVVIAVVLHHWLFFSGPHNAFSPFDQPLDLVWGVSGTFVHLFFILSGCGLTISHFQRGPGSWREWANRRFAKIIIPYWTVVCFTFLGANLWHRVYPALLPESYSSETLLTYLTLTRNFYSPGWTLNESLWFMPVIVGLYLLFPFLIELLERYGPALLMLVSLILTYGSITVGVLTRYSMSHQAAIPLFHLIEFSFGMLIGYWFCFSRERSQFLFSTRFFLIGLALYCTSWLMTHVWAYGDDYNDFFTAVGVFAFGMQAHKWLTRFSLKVAVEILKQTSKVSYLVYLIHLPLITFFVKPLLLSSFEIGFSPLVILGSGIVYIAFVFAVAALVFPWFSRMTSAIAGVRFQWGNMIGTSP